MSKDRIKAARVERSRLLLLATTALATASIMLLSMVFSPVAYSMGNKEDAAKKAEEKAEKKEMKAEEKAEKKEMKAEEKEKKAEEKEMKAEEKAKEEPKK